VRKIKGDLVLIQFSDFGLGRGLYLAKALSLLGLNVTIVTNKPVYSSTHHACVRFSKDLTPDFDARVIEFRIPFARTLYSSIFGRLIVEIIFTMLSFYEVFVSNPQPKILYARTTPFSEISCLFYKFFKRHVKIISDTTDLYPDGLEYIKMNPVLKRMLIAVGHSINHSIYSNVDAVVTLNATMGETLRERFKRDAYILNGVIDLNRFKPVDRNDAFGILSREISTTMLGKFVVLYAGVMSPFQNPLVIADIAEIS